MRARIARAALLLPAVLLLGACSADAPSFGTDESPRRVDLTMTDEMAFEPPTIEVRRGETVRFVVRNASAEDHEAYIGTEDEQRIHATDHSGFGPREQTDVTHMGYGVHVPSRGNGELVAQFNEDTEYVIGCHYPGHYEAGMRAVIQVADQRD